MTTDAAPALDRLLDARYLALEVALEPVGPPTIQLTTFANTGPSFYDAPDGRLAAVVDSVASMANQLELTVWDETECVPKGSVAALPWVKVIDAAEGYYTSSRMAAHRLGAHAIMNGIVLDGKGKGGAKTFQERLEERLADAQPPYARRLAQAAWEHDPLALLHGCWFAGIWGGRARLSRALSARIDALGVQTQSVQVGGQKTADHPSEVGVRQAGAEGETVLGEVPHYTAEVSAERIVAPILLDLALLRSYGLEEKASRALVATAVLMVRELVDAWPRRRSRCVLLPKGEPAVRLPQGWTLPKLADLRAECQRRCREATGRERAEPLVVRYAADNAQQRREPRPAAGGPASAERSAADDGKKRRSRKEEET
jgi:CRISPR-associated protein Csb1